MASSIIASDASKSNGKNIISLKSIAANGKDEITSTTVVSNDKNIDQNYNKEKDTSYLIIGTGAVGTLGYMIGTPLALLLSKILS